MDKVILINYKGEFTFETISYLLDQVKEKLNTLEIKTGVRKKVFNIMVECVENIFKYTEMEGTSQYINQDFESRIVLEKEDDIFIVTSGNTVVNPSVDFLKYQIDKVNSMDRAGQKDLYESVIANGNIHDKGGAGLGIIDIAMKSNNKLEYNFSPIDEKTSFYELKVRINESN